MYPFNMELLEPQNPVDVSALENREVSCPFLVSNPEYLVLQLDSHYTDCDIPASGVFCVTVTKLYRFILSQDGGAEMNCLLAILVWISLIRCTIRSYLTLYRRSALFKDPVRTAL
jgi:hypothetical protein